jgi:septal ring factor EnvC (AmiA/AmiB activator)
MATVFSTTMNETVVLYVQGCITCGVVFAIPKDLDDRLRETHKNFYCPSGHRQHYTGDSDAEKLRKQLDTEQRRRRNVESELTGERQEHRYTQHSLRATKGATTKLKRRISKGVCPCCQRTFANLHKHMAGQHPGYAPETEG